jgi:hypothetical protein
MTKFYVDTLGVYLGGFDGAEPPAGAIEVTEPPAHGDDKWINGAWVSAVVVPQAVTRRQAKQALVLNGKLASVQPAITAITDATQRSLMQIEWDDSQEFVRSRSTLIQIGAAIGLDAAGLDALFIQASGL